MNKEIYFDNAATTKVRPEVAKEILKSFEESYGNPSSIYKIASQNKKVSSKQVGIVGSFGFRNKQ